MERNMDVHIQKNIAANGRLIVAILAAVALLGDIPPYSQRMILIPALVSLGMAYAADIFDLMEARSVAIATGLISTLCAVIGVASAISAYL